MASAMDRNIVTSGNLLPKMLAERNALALIRIRDGSVEFRRTFGQALVCQPADDLVILDQERHLERPDLEDRPRARAILLVETEARIEEPGVVHAKLADQRVVRNHFGGMRVRNLDRLTGRQDVKVL